MVVRVRPPRPTSSPSPSAVGDQLPDALMAPSPAHLPCPVEGFGAHPGSRVPGGHVGVRVEHDQVVGMLRPDWDQDSLSVVTSTHEVCRSPTQPADGAGCRLPPAGCRLDRGPPTRCLARMARSGVLTTCLAKPTTLLAKAPPAAARVRGHSTCQRLPAPTTTCVRREARDLCH